MAKQYWIKRISNAPAEGPYTAQQLRAFAQQGHITAAALISADGHRWYSFAHVKGLFPPKSAAPSSSSAPSPADEQFGIASDRPGGEDDDRGYRVEDEPPAGVARSRPFARSSVAGAGVQAGTQSAAFGSQVSPGRSRNLTWYIVLGAVIAIYGLIAWVISIVENLRYLAEHPNDGGPFNNAPLMLGDCLNCLLLPMLIGMWIYFLVWIYTVHDEMAKFTGGRHPISAAQALGLSLVPLFNFGWQAHALYRLSDSVAERLGPGQRAISPAATLILTILAAVPGCCLLWPMPLLMGVAMHLTQKGLNALWARTTPTPPGWGPQPY